jgi:pimeloyl-ACP methyl ester carboxylesterase
MPAHYDAETIHRVRRAMKAAAIPRSPAELAQAIARVDESEREATIARWHADVARHTPLPDVNEGAPAPKLAPIDAPDTLVDLVLAGARGQSDGGSLVPWVDDFVTGRRGWLQCHAALAVPPWSVATLASSLEAEARAKDAKIDPARVAAISKTIADRASRVGHYVTLPHGDERESLRVALAPIGAGPNPYGPVHASATRWGAREIEITQPIRCRLRYVEVGPPDGPVLLLVHGHSSRIEELDALIELLRDRYRIVICDLPGCGYSDHPALRYSIGLYENVLLAFLRALGIRRCSVLGGSMGANLALRLALAHHGIVERAIAWAPIGWWKPNHLLALGARIFTRAPEHAFWVSLEIQSKSWYLPTWTGRDAALRDGFAYRREVYGPEYHEAYFEIAADQLDTTMRDKAKDISIPVMLLVGAHDDELGMREAVPALAREIPRATHAVVANAAHSVANEQPAVLADHIRRFLGA